MIRLDIGSLPEGHSHRDLEADASELDIDLEGGRLASPITVSLDIVRHGDELVLTGRASVEAVLECGRCLEEYSCTLGGPVSLGVVVGEEQAEAGEGQEDVITVPSGATYADITDQIRSELLVRVPLKPLCKKECRGLCPRCGANLNLERCSCRTVSGDSRWDALKNLKRGQ